MRSDTVQITIDAPPKAVFDFIANVANWSRFSDWAAEVEDRSNHWVIRNPQGEYKLVPKFHRTLLILDHRITMPSGRIVLIPYRVVPNEDGSELIMTNFQNPEDSDAAYEEQMEWARNELGKAKVLIEDLYRSSK